ncbi:adhesion G protein-coupled receptor L4-like [Anneissia japonica]|uniref:adhesion G protein-coupled receptor L4-like n=1 Tax=Anneissia japonica TaxID=1529436 RepID=UPI0014256E4A|nr:adhesion G protein-coupled receptor L4-like [Anneissia japonica]
MGNVYFSKVHNQNDTWWYVDLQSPSIVSKIVIYHRVECCQEQLNGAVVRVGNSTSSPFTRNTQCGPTITMEMITEPYKEPIEMTCTPHTTGRYITIYLNSSEPLVLCEVQAYKDVGSPVIVCPENIDAVSELEQSNITWNEVNVTDNVDNDLGAACDPPSGSLFSVGSTNVTCTVTDAARNEGSCSFIVNINDTGSPVITCPENFFVRFEHDVDQHVHPVTWSDVNVTDNVDTGLRATCSPSSGSLFAVGSTNVTCSAVDLSNNNEMCTFIVTIKEYEKNGSIKVHDLVETAYNSLTINNEMTEFNMADLTDMLFINLYSRIDEEFYKISFPKIELVATKLNLNSWKNYSFSVDLKNVSIDLEFNTVVSGAVISIIACVLDYNYTNDTHIDRNQMYYLKSRLLSIAAYTENGTEIYPNVQFEIETIDIEQMLIESQETKDFNLTLVCGFIDVNLKEWSTSGCNLIEIIATRAVCSCNHLTSFGVLMQVTSYEPENQTRKALSIISTIGVILSIVLLTVTEVVFLVLKDLWKSLRNNIHKNLVFNLIVFDVIFLVGIDKVDNPITCKSIAMTLHLFLMTVFFWMFGEAVFLVFKVMYTTPSRHNRLRNYMICCYSAPIMIVVPIAIFEYDVYGNTYCWLDSNVNWLVVAPAAAIVLLNTIVLVMLVRIIHHRSGTNVQASRQHEYKQLKKAIKGALLLMPINGGTWMFGPLAMNEDSVFMQYLFVIFNSFQGVFIFIVYCLLDTEVKLNWKKLCGRGRNQIQTTKTTGISQVEI